MPLDNCVSWAPERAPTPSELRRQQVEASRRADEALRAARRRTRGPREQIEHGLAGEGHAGTLAGWVAALVAPVGSPTASPVAAGRTPRPQIDAFRRLLLAALQRRSALTERESYVTALARLAAARPDWRRQPQEWVARTHNPTRQFASLARHLLADYPVPAWLDQAWLDDGPVCAAARAWFAHVGRGGNLRTAEDLPFPLTKRMAHVIMLPASTGGPPAGMTPAQTLRWAQIVGLGGTDRVARAAAATRLGSPAPDEPFWLTLGMFLARHPMLDPTQVGPIVDFLFAQRFDPLGRMYDSAAGVFREAGPPQPALSMKGRTAASLLRQVHQWHRTLAGGGRGAGPGDTRRLVWATSGIRGFDRVEGEPGNQRRFLVLELLSSAELLAEGRAMHHCVYSYAQRCAQGTCAIFSLRLDTGSGHGLERRVTIEVTPQLRAIVQARARDNAAADALDQRIIRAWAAGAGLTIKRLC